MLPTPFRSRRLFFALAAVAAPATALTQHEMQQQYEASARPIPCRYHSFYRDGMLVFSDYVPSLDTARPLGLALTLRGCRLDDGLPDDTPVRPEDEFRLRVRCVAADGSRMGYIQLMVRADGSLLCVERSSKPGDYVAKQPFVFHHREQAATLTWKYVAGAFRGLSVEYSVGSQSGIEYGPDGEVKTVSFIPSRQWPSPPTPPAWELEEGEFESPPPVVDMSGVEGTLGAGEAP